MEDSEFEQILASSSNNKTEFLKLDQLVASRVKDKLIINDKKIDEGLNIWDIAQAGIRGIGKLTGKKYELDTQVNDNGKVSLLAFNSRNFEISRSR